MRCERATTGTICNMSQQNEKAPKSATWSDRVSSAIGRRIGEERRLRKLSAQQVADRLAGIGHPLSRATLSLIETGQRGVSLADVIAIATALRTVPLALMVGYGEEAVEALPGVFVESGEAAEWIAEGGRPLRDSRTTSLEDWVGGRAQGVPGTLLDRNRLWHRYRSHSRALSQLARLRAELLHAEVEARSGEGEARASLGALRASYGYHLEALAHERQYLARLRMPLPGIPTWLMQEIEDLGLDDMPPVEEVLADQLPMRDGDGRRLADPTFDDLFGRTDDAS